MKVDLVGEEAGALGMGGGELRSEADASSRGTDTDEFRGTGESSGMGIFDTGIASAAADPGIELSIGAEPGGCVCSVSEESMLGLCSLPVSVAAAELEGGIS